MIARLRKLVVDLGDAFWLLPTCMVVAGVGVGVGLVALDRGGWLPEWLQGSGWMYDGTGTGARTLLGAVAGSTIGVAGTVFSITIAALSLAAGQMGPRLLRNFTRDRGNQFTLGTFLGTFAYALMVLRSVQDGDDGAAVPHLALFVAVLLALLCVATLVYFVGHMAGRINVQTVIALVGDDLDAAIERLTKGKAQPAPPPDDFWQGADPIIDRRRGYLQEIDDQGLADWAAKSGTVVRLLVRPGDYVFPGATIAVMTRPVEGAGDAIVNATALGETRMSSQDLEYAARQLVEVAVRALSPGINDPNTAIEVLDRLGAALCDVAGAHLPTGVIERNGSAALVIPGFGYDGLVDVMFHMVRQYGADSPAVLVRILEVLTAVAGCEREPSRMAALRRHADLVAGDAERNISTPSDVRDVRGRREAFERVCAAGATALLSS